MTNDRLQQLWVVPENWNQHPLGQYRLHTQALVVERARIRRSISLLYPDQIDAFWGIMRRDRTAVRVL
jgi:hypothetical protein